MKDKPQNATAIEVASPSEIQIIQAKSAAQFALTPIGQQVKLFEAQQRMAQMYVTSTIIPETYRGNLGNCVIAIDMAMRMNMNPMTIFQNLYIVHGNPAFSSKFLIATINASGRFSPLRYEFRGEEGKPSHACRALAYESQDRERKEPLYGDWISMEMAKKEGWMDKSGSKWLSMPNQMLRYRAAAFWQRVYCPEISMGLMTSEEYEEIDDQTHADYKSEIAAKSNRQTIGIDVAEQPSEQEPPAEPATPEVRQEQPLGKAPQTPSFMR